MTIDILETVKNALLDKIESESIHAAVIGLGYVGLPLAVTLAQAGYRVTELDVDQAKVDRVNEGESYIPDLTSETIARLLRSGRLEASTDFSILDDCDAISVCVPTPLRKTRDPDVSYVIAAAESIGRHIRPGTVVILESTTYPGTTREVILPRLENTETGLEVGRTFFLAFSPERVDPGRKDWKTRNTPKVIGRHHRGLSGSGLGLLRSGDRVSRSCIVSGGGRDGQAAREHVSVGQHRTGKRDATHV
ncbi:MAG TPA: NAD(P)-binding domain-containing protein [Chloroflexota bacterium]|jgi:UDP-N-acetyl-D-glucosamine dehydrogenase|nr:NAD(P)-binding domain-containing protein [Chloroflexota bacterium]